MYNFIRQNKEKLINKEYSKEFFDLLCDFLIELDNESDRSVTNDFIEKMYLYLLYYIYIPEIQSYWVYINIERLIYCIIEYLDEYPNDKENVYKECLYSANKYENYITEDYNKEKYNIDFSFENIRKNFYSILKKYTIDESVKTELEEKRYDGIE